MSGVWLPMVLLFVAGFLIFLALRRIFRPEPTLEEILAQPLPKGRQEPQLYPVTVTPDGGLRASVEARWPVGR